MVWVGSLAGCEALAVVEVQAGNQVQLVVEDQAVFGIGPGRGPETLATIRPELALRCTRKRASGVDPGAAMAPQSNQTEKTAPDKRNPGAGQEM